MPGEYVRGVRRAIDYKPVIDRAGTLARFHQPFLSATAPMLGIAISLFVHVYLRQPSGA